jgi:hypothetical protein
MMAMIICLAGGSAFAACSFLEGILAALEIMD